MTKRKLDPSEIIHEVGKDEEEYFNDELAEQSYTDEGKDTREKTEDDANPKINPSRRVA